MKLMFKILKFKIFLFNNNFFYFKFISLADNHNIYETLEKIKKDIKTLERAVYSSSSEFNTGIIIINSTS